MLRTCTQHLRVITKKSCTNNINNTTMRPSPFAVTATVAAAAVVANVPTFSSAFSLRPIPSFFHSSSLPLKTTTTTSSTSTTTQLFSSASSSDLLQVSRIKTLQNLLSLCGAPGSSTCNQANDLIPVSSDEEDIQDLHPHLFPISKSKSSGNYICALMMNTNDDDDNIKKNQPMAIVESGSGKPGMKLLSLNSEQMMRRIAAEADDSSDLDGTEIVQIYNEGLGQGKVDSAFDTQYEIGSVAKLGYGPSKYTLLRIGPFPDLYQEMSQNHLSERNDESSALIAAESANGKFGGFGQPYASYAQLLNTLEKREDECRDAARVCLRLPLWTCAMTFEELANISYLAGLTTKDDDEVIEDDTTFKISKMKEMYEKIKTQNEQQESTAGESKTEEQIYLDEATYLMDNTILSSGIAEEKEDKYCKWDDIREQLSDLYKKAGKTDMADFVLKKK